MFLKYWRWNIYLMVEFTVEFTGSRRDDKEAWDIVSLWWQRLVRVPDIWCCPHSTKSLKTLPFVLKSRIGHSAMSFLLQSLFKACMIISVHPVCITDSILYVFKALKTLIYTYLIGPCTKKGSHANESLFLLFLYWVVLLFTPSYSSKTMFSYFALWWL